MWNPITASFMLRLSSRCERLGLPYTDVRVLRIRANQLLEWTHAQLHMPLV